MPFIIRIILQRALILIYSVLAFLGISPEAQIPNKERANEIIEERREAFSEILEKKVDTSDIENALKGITDAGDLLPETHNPDASNGTIPTLPIKNIIPEAPEKIDNVTTTQPSVTKPIQGISSIIAGDTSDSVKNVVVNTICTRKQGNAVTVSTGSGVIVSSEGVVLTNAHVAQFFIIQDHDNNVIDCSVYKESAPSFGYKAEILYVSPDWIFENYKTISQLNAVGTGEEDYAFLHITGSTNPTLPIPSSFPYANVDIEIKPEKGDPVIAAGYPGAPSSLAEISKSGKLQVDSIYIDDVFTFGPGNIDIITTGKTHVGAKGASGGGIFSGQDVNKSNLIGTISTTQGVNGDAHINAITSSYINRDIIKDTGKNINYYLRNNLTKKSNSFKDIYLDEFSELLISEL